MRPSSEFFRKVISLIQKIPNGKVATYGQIAALAGKEQGSRGVAWILHSCSTSYKLPWHRVINSQGKISFPSDTGNYSRQKKLLALEGVEMSLGKKYNMEKYQWKKKGSRAKKSFRILSSDSSTFGPRTILFYKNPADTCKVSDGGFLGVDFFVMKKFFFADVVRSKWRNS